MLESNSGGEINFGFLDTSENLRCYYFATRVFLEVGTVAGK